MNEHTNCHRTGKADGKKMPAPSEVKKISLTSPKTDPQGMYTGVPENPYDDPVQDADDL